jgi:hypothetical protein
MAKVTVGTTPVALPVDRGETPIIQNLGPGVVYLDTRSNVSTGTGLQVAVNSAYEWPTDVTSAVYAVADVADTDVRIMVVN